MTFFLLWNTKDDILCMDQNKWEDNLEKKFFFVSQKKQQLTFE